MGVLTTSPVAFDFLAMPSKLQLYHADGRMGGWSTARAESDVNRRYLYLRHQLMMMMMMVYYVLHTNRKRSDL